jgi:hypothetical protein
MGNTSLLDRVRALLKRRRGVTELRMFGGHCFLVNRNMLGGVTGGDELIIRVGPEDYADALRHPHAREMNFTGRPMRGFVMVDAEGCSTQDDLRFWLGWGHSFAKSLPPK